MSLLPLRRLTQLTEPPSPHSALPTACRKCSQARASSQQQADGSISRTTDRKCHECPDSTPGTRRLHHSPSPPGVKTPARAQPAGPRGSGRQPLEGFLLHMPQATLSGPNICAKTPDASRRNEPAALHTAMPRALPCGHVAHTRTLTGPLGQPGPQLPAEASSLRLWGGSSIILLRSPRSLRSLGFSQTESCMVGLKKNTRSSPVHTTHLWVESLSSGTLRCYKAVSRCPASLCPQKTKQPTWAQGSSGRPQGSALPRTPGLLDGSAAPEDGCGQARPALVFVVDAATPEAAGVTSRAVPQGRVRPWRAASAKPLTCRHPTSKVRAQQICPGE